MASRDTVTIVYSKPFTLPTISFSQKTNESLKTITVCNLIQDAFRTAASLQTQTAHQQICVQSYNLKMTLVDSERPSNFQSMPFEKKTPANEGETRTMEARLPGFVASVCTPDSLRFFPDESAGAYNRPIYKSRYLYINLHSSVHSIYA